MIVVERPHMADRADIERLISEYHVSEGLTPQADRIEWAVSLALRNQFPGILLIARDETKIVGVALGTYSPSAELGRVLMVNDFYVKPPARRKGVGRQLARKLLEEAKRMWIDQVDLEVLPANTIAANFWESLCFRTQGRRIYSLDLKQSMSKISGTTLGRAPGSTI